MVAAIFFVLSTLRVYMYELHIILIWQTGTLSRREKAPIIVQNPNCYEKI